jgi:hypothetical protein
MRIEETIPDPLAAEAEAARAWFAAEHAGEFKLTGIVDPDDALAADTDARELQLILCGTQEGQEVCLRERFRVRSGDGAGGFEVTHVAAESPAVGSPAPLLDPPEGVRKGWVDEALAKHSFVVFLFYRGFW